MRMTTNIVNHRKKDDAVSPVVGVMLMIVVTIVIAAVVALFATNVMSDTEVAPISMIKMSAESDGDKLSYLSMSVYGGDPINLSKIDVQVTCDNGESGVIIHMPIGDSGVQDWLKVGERLNLVKEGVGEMEPIGHSTVEAALARLGEQEVIHVLVIYNESATLFDKNLRVSG